MHSPHDIRPLFNKFAGREIEMIETARTVRIGGKDQIRTEARLADPQNPLIADMHDTATNAGFRLRLWFPGSIGTRDVRADRINAHIEKSPDGKYRVAARFHIG